MKASQIAAAIRKEHPDWSPEQRAEELRRRYYSGGE